MRLRTFESFGLVQNGILHSYPSLHSGNESCDIVVVGAGISGALVSHALVEKNYSVILLDKRNVASGSTAATTSMLQYEIDVPLHNLAQMIGEKEAVACYKAGVKAIHDLKKLIDKHKFKCGFELKKSLFVAREKKHVKELWREYEFRKKHSFAVKWLEPSVVMEDYGMISHGAILSDVAGSMDAYRFTHELVAYNAKRGMKVYDQTKIGKFDFSGERVLIHTEEGSKVDCKKIIFCSGYESTELLKEKVADIFHTYASVSERNIKVTEKLKNTLVWDTASPYMYMRYTDDGRLLIGGEDVHGIPTYFQNSIKERKGRKLRENLQEIMPDVKFVEDFSWGGTFGSTKDGLPYIGKSPEYDKALFVLGFGGNGIVFSVQAMDIIPDLLIGKKNELAEYYRFKR